MNQLVIHPTTNKFINSYIASPSHALLLLGGEGSGKSTLLKHVAANLLGVDNEVLLRQPYFRLISSAGNSISIEAIRDLQEFLKLKTPGGKGIRRVAIIEDAHKLTTEAQNAFLKILEEPPRDSAFILSAISDNSLLPTVVSRLTTISVNTPSVEQISQYFNAGGYQEQDIKRYLHISDGKMGLMSELLQAGEQHPLSEQISRAKQIVSSDIFSRLTEIDSLVKDKDNLPLFLSALKKIFQAGLKRSVETNNLPEIKKWTAKLSKTQTALKHIEQNASAKLVLTNIFLNI